MLFNAADDGNTYDYRKPYVIVDADNNDDDDDNDDIIIIRHIETGIIFYLKISMTFEVNMNWLIGTR